MWHPGTVETKPSHFSFQYLALPGTVAGMMMLYNYHTGNICIFLPSSTISHSSIASPEALLRVGMDLHLHGPVKQEKWVHFVMSPSPVYM